MPSAIRLNMFRLRCTDRRPAAHEERRAGPQHDRARQHDLHPVGDAWRYQPIETVSRPSTGPPDDGDQRQDERQPRKRRRMSLSSGFVTSRRTWRQRLECHAAERAASRMVLAAPRDASDRSRPLLAERATLAAVRRGENIFPDQQRIFRGTRRSKSENLSPWNSKRCFEVSGSTVMPQTGSRSIAVPSIRPCGCASFMGPEYCDSRTVLKSAPAHGFYAATG